MKTTIIGAVLALSFAVTPAMAMPLPLNAAIVGSTFVEQVNATGDEQPGLKRKQALEAKKAARTAQKEQKKTELQAKKAEKKAALDAKKAEKQAALQAKKAARKAKRAAKKAAKPAST
jgi:Skp family chaperone for outer membrane proteins